jgi:hypothetical protein
MRTSVTLDDDVYQLAFLYAKGRGLTLGAAISELVRKGESAPRSEAHSSELVRESNGLLVFAARPGKMITPEIVKKYQEDEIE